MAGLVKWRQAAIVTANPDADHIYIGVDIVDGQIYAKDSAGNVTKFATNAYVQQQILDLIDSAPSTLDTLNELAAALADDPNFATTITNALALKANTADLGALAFLNIVGNSEIATNAITAVKINNNSVLNSKLSDMPTLTLKGNDTGATADPKDLTVSETKTMLALDQVDNTSDLAKPISTATQTALNLKYDASNPNGYETPAQLNTRDTNNRARANHTGSQLAATISNFAATVLSTVLTGYTVGANVALAATDTILQAFGKLQGQLNQAISDVNATFAVVNARLDVLEANFFGTSFESFVDSVVSTTTSGAQPLTAVASSFTTASVPAGNYRIQIQYNWSNSSTNADSRFALFVDGVQISDQHNEELRDNSTNKNDQILVFVSLSAATHTIELRFGSEGGVTTTVNMVDCEFWRVS